jgi:hypothetical protein
MEFIDEGIEEYARLHTEPENDLLKELVRETHAMVLQPRMLSGHLQGRLSTFSHPRNRDIYRLFCPLYGGRFKSRWSFDYD